MKIGLKGLYFSAVRKLKAGLGGHSNENGIMTQEKVEKGDLWDPYMKDLEMLQCKFKPDTQKNWLKRGFQDTDAQMRPKSRRGLTWDFKIYDDWLTEHIYVRYNDNRGKTEWCNMVARYMDYLVNPVIRVKHREVFEFFFNNYVNYLESDEGLSVFKLCKDKIRSLMDECYSISNPGYNKDLFHCFEKLSRKCD